MLRILLSVLVLTLALGAVAPRRAQAERAVAAVEVLVRSPRLQADAPETAALTGAALRLILIDRILNEPFWDCLDAGGADLLALVGVRILVDELAPPVYTVRGELWVLGTDLAVQMPMLTVQGTPRPTPDWIGPFPDPLAAEQIKDVAASWLRTTLALRSITPCLFKVKFTARANVSQPALIQPTTFEGEAWFALDKEGKFKGLNPLTVQSTQSGACVGTDTFPDSYFTIRGEYQRGA